MDRQLAAIRKPWIPQLQNTNDFEVQARKCGAAGGKASLLVDRFEPSGQRTSLVMRCIHGVEDSLPSRRCPLPKHCHLHGSTATCMEALSLAGKHCHLHGSLTHGFHSCIVPNQRDDAQRHAKPAVAAACCCYCCCCCSHHLEDGISVGQRGEVHVRKHEVLCAPGARKRCLPPIKDVRDVHDLRSECNAQCE